MEVEEGKMLFKLRKGKGSVESFMGPDGFRHFPGEVVELPASYLGLAWLEPVAKEAKPVVAAPSKVEPANPVEAPAPAALVSTKKLRKTL